jgi:hypothetical protein
MLMIPAAAHAQDAGVCRDTETLRQCMERLVNGDSTRAVVETSTLAGEEERLERAATGVGVPATGVESAIRDFVPRLLAAVVDPRLATAGSGLGVNWNLPGEYLGGKLQLGATLNEATVFARIAELVTDSQREATRKQLQGGLGQFDDVTLTAAYNLQNDHVGRSFAPHQQLFNRLLRDAQRLVPGGAAEDADIALANALLALNNVVVSTRRDAPECAANLQLSELRMDCLSAGARAAIEAAVAPFAETERAREQALVAGLRSAGFGRLAELVNNQPQVNFSFEYRARTGAAGPEEWTGKARYETGGGNLNGMRRFCRSRGLALESLNCLGEYTRAKEGALERGERVWVSLEATGRLPYQFELASPPVSLDLPHAWQFELSAGYGAYLNLVKPEDLRDRIDLDASYKVVRDDPLRQDRFVAHANYTYRLTDQTSGTIGLTYANRPEFLGEVDHKLGAHLGLTLKLPPGER